MNHLGYDSDAVAPGTRFDAYHDLYSAGAVVRPAGDGFAARVNGWLLDRALLYDRSLNEVEHERSDTCVRRSGFDHFTLTLALGGELHTDGGSGYRALAPGEIQILDMTRPTRSVARGARLLTMSMARDRVAQLIGDPRALHERVIPRDHGFLLADHLASLARGGDRLMASSLMAIARTSIDLLGVALAGDVLREGAVRHPTGARVDRVRAFIEERLFDPDFGPPDVIARFALSRATLYRDFAAWDGLGNYIRMRRVEAMRDRLADETEQRSLADLSDALGFSTEARASEAFLRRFGTRPGRYRTSTRGEAEPARAARRMREWQSVLR